MHLAGDRQPFDGHPARLHARIPMGRIHIAEGAAQHVLDQALAGLSGGWPR